VSERAGGHLDASRHVDRICQTRTRDAPGRMPSTSASFSRVERAGACERHAPPPLQDPSHNELAFVRTLR
jgi:hypothetical protein